MKNAFLIGQRIYLRPLELEDAPQLAAYINDPEVRETLQMYRPVNQVFEKQFIERISKPENDVVLGIALRQDDRLIGATGLHGLSLKDRKASFGISIGAKDQWNKGFGSEALRLIVDYGFRTLNLNRILLHVYAFNERAKHVYEKAGFRREGAMRQDVYCNGEYHDVLIMGLLRQDWQPKP